MKVERALFRTSSSNSAFLLGSGFKRVGIERELKATLICYARQKAKLTREFHVFDTFRIGGEEVFGEINWFGGVNGERIN